MQKTLKEKHAEFISRVKAYGGNVLSLTCPLCKVAHEVPGPMPGEVWDTITTCPECEGHFIKICTHTEARGHSLTLPEVMH